MLDCSEVGGAIAVVGRVQQRARALRIRGRACAALRRFCVSQGRRRAGERARLVAVGRAGRSAHAARERPTSVPSFYWRQGLQNVCARPSATCDRATALGSLRRDSKSSVRDASRSITAVRCTRVTNGLGATTWSQSSPSASRSALRRLLEILGPQQSRAARHARVQRKVHEHVGGRERGNGAAVELDSFGTHQQVHRWHRVHGAQLGFVAHVPVQIDHRPGRHPHMDLAVHPAARELPIALEQDSADVPEQR